MSKYYKAEDVINTIEECIAKQEMLDSLDHLPTIEVSEDCISRKINAPRIVPMFEDCISRSELVERFVELIERANSPYLKRGIRWAIGYTQSAPSVVPKIEVMEYPQVEGITPTLVTIEQSSEVGEWTNAGILTVRCSNCKSEFHELEAMNYCPNCGEKKKGAEE